MTKRRETRKAWAIWMPGDYPGFAGHGWFDWMEGYPHVHGSRIALFATRREARAAIKERMTGSGANWARGVHACQAVRVRVTITCL